MGRACRNSARSAADRFNKIMKHTVCKVVTVMFALLPVFGLFGCGGSKKYTSDDVVLINTAYYGTEMKPVYSFALKKEKDGWLFSADCLVGSQRDHYASFGSFPITEEDAEGFLRILRRHGKSRKRGVMLLLLSHKAVRRENPSVFFLFQGKGVYRVPCRAVINGTEQNKLIGSMLFASAAAEKSENRQKS